MQISSKKTIPKKKIHPEREHLAGIYPTEYAQP